jgi:hypothetical protein
MLTHDVSYENACKERACVGDDVSNKIGNPQVTLKIIFGL